MLSGRSTRRENISAKHYEASHKTQLPSSACQGRNYGSRLSVPRDPSHLKTKAAFPLPHPVGKKHPWLSLAKVEPAYHGTLMQDRVQKRYFL